MGVTSANRYLSADEMQGNAAYIAAFFLGRGWTSNAVAAMLGNMESESGINPGIYEGLDSTSDTNGYGLVQWTPNTKYKTWADANGYAYGDIKGQCERILYELENGLQWIPTDAYPMSFEEFAHSTDDVLTLAAAFVYNYERPAEPNPVQRGLQASQWAAFLVGITIPGASVVKPMSKLLLYFAALRR